MVADVTVTATVQAAPGSPLEAVALAASQTYEANANDNIVRLSNVG
ncbi:MAG TPA: hypothetical protein VFE49_00010 [Jiangellaceae bacterium]|nr:hypothetical protein [Jiangellaceae bacterium]